MCRVGKRTLAMLAAFGLCIFIWHTVSSRHPFLNPALFTNWNFAMGLLMAFVMGALSYTPIVLFPPLLQDLRSYPDSIIGYLMSARGLGNLISFMIVVPCTRYNARLTLAVGLFLQAYAGWEMSQLDMNMSNYDVFWTNFVQGFGFGLAYTPMTALAFSTLPQQLIVQGSAVFNQMRNFGSSLFISLSILVLVRSTAENYAGLSAAVSPMNELMRNPALIGSWAWENSRGLAALSAEIQRQALMGGYLNAFALFAVAAAVGVPLAWLFRERKART
jgi:DHA2 family multidrug resistance protein